MTALSLRGRRALLTRGTWAACLLVILGVLGGCAGSTPIQVPAELPLRTNDGVFKIRWALQREPTVARAIGQIEYDLDIEYWIALAFYGLDGDRRILSRGITYVQSSLSYAPIPFEVDLKPTGRETSFELRVQSYRSSGSHMRGR
jgi:hypothetical protein